MGSKGYKVESKKPFSESLIWQLNRDYYQKKGLDAWRDGTVPHHLTSNAMVGKTYAELIFAFLKDLAEKGQTKETVFLIELGAGNGRLAFHILKHLEELKLQCNKLLPPYCYVLSDIVEDNLNFFLKHPQFKYFFDEGLLDVTYFDGIESKEILLRHSGKKILPKDLDQPILVIANYFFDSIPSDLFYFKDKTISSCSISLETDEDPGDMDESSILKNIKPTFHKETTKLPFYEKAIFNQMLVEYQDLVFNAHLFFPQKGLQCIHHLQQLSNKGLMLISMDKGFHEIHDLENAKEPEMIAHGSFSIWVNYHAFGLYCTRQGGKALFNSSSTFHLDLACLLFLPDSKSYNETQMAYQRYVNNFGPDDFNSFKQLTYRLKPKMGLQELLAMLRLSAYDSTLFIKILPQLKLVSQQISFNQRTRLSEAMHHTWDIYYSIDEAYDLAFEIGGLFYALGYYKDALNYFQHSINQYGHTADVFYNRALCYYQLHEDDLFLQIVKEAKASFPAYEKFTYLETLDMQA